MYLNAHVCKLNNLIKYKKSHSHCTIIEVFLLLDSMFINVIKTILNISVLQVLRISYSAYTLLQQL